MQFLGIFPSSVLRDGDLSTPWAGEIEQRIFSSAVGARSPSHGLKPLVLPSIGVSASVHTDERVIKSALPRSQASAHTWSARFSINRRARSWSLMPSFSYHSRHPRSVARFAWPVSKYAESWHRQHQGELWVIV